jgi:eukaryotic-like serine/threonine-protein kinase
MTTWDGARWQAAAKELDQLLELDGPARDAAMAALLRRDAALAADVARLLADLGAAQAERFLDPDTTSPLPTTATQGDPAAGDRRSASLVEGAVFGEYRILAVLGRGGMGVVYEAEEIESGRRVALKVLEHRLADAGQRERFQREGRLAASIDHEHCVFVLAAIEVDGVPAIAMELMQETLADRLGRSGPLPPAAAVDATLQLVAGLDAAARVGVLHRDVKPSNCFVDADGVVKIGDFGISRSLSSAGDATDTSAYRHDSGVVTHEARRRISATPAYASPEQLRGETLDVRADIYSVGATLYELITGRRPFAGADLMSLLMAVANDQPTAPHTIVPAIPRGLSRVVLQCLGKQPDDRFADYASLAAALAPYRSVAPTPATLGRRLLAGAIDFLALRFLTDVVLLTIVLPLASSVPLPVRTLIAIAPWLLYFGVTESIWACSPGKALCGLMVVDRRRRPISGRRAWARAALFALALLATIQVFSRWVLPGPFELLRYRPVWRMVFEHGTLLLFIAVPFVVARRRNGYAALHDLATSTRVVAAPERLPSPGRRAAPALTAPAHVAGRYGTFVVHDRPVDDLVGWCTGVDERLRRPIWVRESIPGTPPVSVARARVSRPTRLRWLAGRRTADSAWDVYESAAGVPLARACATPRRWREVRGWLLDLARELAAQDARDRPPRRLDRVWVLDSGRVKLLDDPTADTTAGAAANPSPSELLHAVASLARRGAPEPWPLSAERYVASLGSPDRRATADLAQELEAIGGRDSMTRGWRALTLAAQLAVPLVLVAYPLFLTAVAESTIPPRVEIAVWRLANRLVTADRGGTRLDPADRDAIEAVLAALYRSGPQAGRIIDRIREQHQDGGARRRLNEALRRHPTDAAAEAAASRPIVRATLRPRSSAPSAFYLAMLIYDALVKVALLALASAIAARSGLFRLLGFEIVTARGEPASPLRIAVRSALAWSAVLAPAAIFAVSNDWFTAIATNIQVVYAALAIQAAGAAAVLIHPTRSLQDRLAGTWIVPR